MRVLKREELSKNLGYCAYYIGTHVLEPDGSGKFKISDSFAYECNKQVLIFDMDDRFIDKNGNFDNSPMVGREDNHICTSYWLGGVLVYKEKNDESSIDIIEATMRNHVYCVVKDDEIDDILSNKRKLNHHRLLNHLSGNTYCDGGVSTEFQSGLMVVTDGNIRSRKVLLKWGSGFSEFFCNDIDIEEGTLVKCYWSEDGKYIIIPRKIFKGEEKIDNGIKCLNWYDEVDITNDILSNIIDINNMKEMINSKKIESGEDFNYTIIEKVLYSCLYGLSDRLGKDSTLIDDLLDYWKKYIGEIPAENTNSDVESVKDRAAKLLGL